LPASAQIDKLVYSLKEYAAMRYAQVFAEQYSVVTDPLSSIVERNAHLFHPHVILLAQCMENKGFG